MVYGSVLTAAELEFPRTSSLSVVITLNLLHCFPSPFIKNDGAAT